MGQQSDVIVIGAGIIGATIAWRLAREGLSVRMLDAAEMASEASRAGAGMLAPGGEVERVDQAARFLIESLRLYPGYIAALREESGVMIDFRMSGAVELAIGDREIHALEELAAIRAGVGIASEPLDAAALRREVPLLHEPAAAARFYPGDAQVDPVDVAAALRVACSRRGVVIEEYAAAHAVDATSQGVTVRTAGGTRTAAMAVLAAGAWSSSVAVTAAGVPLPLPEAYPVRGHLIGYDLSPGSLGPIVRHGSTYILQRRTGFTLGGTTMERTGFDRGPDPAAIADIRRRCGALMPCLAGAQPLRAWTGFRPGADGGLHLEQAGGSALWLAYGHLRNGILLAPATAEHLCAAMLSASSGRL
ncbi:MAG: FAD-dependent oxidoreductase [Bryobacterales bacterium]|nr:FAD-dependent oxidoreductase [Bryobacterales bacterium]